MIFSTTDLIIVCVYFVLMGLISFVIDKYKARKKPESQIASFYFDESEALNAFVVARVKEMDDNPTKWWVNDRHTNS